MTFSLKHAAVYGALILAMLIVGCVASKYTLVPPAQGKVDPALVGDYDVVNTSGEHATLVVRNINNTLYYLELTSNGDTKIDRYTAFGTKVKDALFIEFRPIEDNGVVDEAWSLMRVDLNDKTLTLRQLSEDFFKKQAIDSSDALKKFVEQNMDKPEFYDGASTLTATKAK